MLAEALIAGWEPFANALMPAPSQIVVANGSDPMAGFMALVSVRRWVDKCPNCGSDHKGMSCVVEAILNADDVEKE